MLTPAELAFECFIDKRELARRMGRCITTVGNMMRRGQLPYYKFGKAVAFRWSEVQAQLAQTCRIGPLNTPKQEEGNSTSPDALTPSPSPVRRARVASDSPQGGEEEVFGRASARPGHTNKSNQQQKGQKL